MTGLPLTSWIASTSARVRSAYTWDREDGLRHFRSGSGQLLKRPNERWSAVTLDVVHADPRYPGPPNIQPERPILNPSSATAHDPFTTQPPRGRLANSPTPWISEWLRRKMARSVDPLCTPPITDTTLTGTPGGFIWSPCLLSEPWHLWTHLVFCSQPIRRNIHKRDGLSKMPKFG
jgi:hypothetical protein